MTILLIAVIAALIGADQLVKYWAATSLQPKGSIDFIHFGSFKIIDLTYLENNGALFGSMSGHRWFLIGFTATVIIAGIFVFFKTRNRSKVLSTAMALFIAGGIGNLIDRIRLGYVIDMFEIKLFRFAIFNVADICVVIAVALLFIYIIFIDAKTEKKSGSSAEKEAKNE